MSNEESNVLIVYHGNCLDGFTSAWIMDRWLREIGFENIDLMPAVYTEDFYQSVYRVLDESTYNRLYVVDFSIPMGYLESYYSILPDIKIIVIDHHKTAFEMYNPGVPVMVDSKYSTEYVSGMEIWLNNAKSGAGMVWSYCNNTPVPYLIKYVQDWDLWRFEFGDDTRYIHHYLANQVQELAVWDAIHEKLEGGRMTKVLAAGYDFKVIHDKEVEMIAKQTISLGYFVHCPYEFRSEVGHAVATKYNSFCIMCDPIDGEEKVEWSLRANGAIDVSDIAKLFGGGGHKNAAGFNLSTEKSMEILNKLFALDAQVRENKVS